MDDLQSSIDLMAFLGCLVSFIFSERFGRKKPLLAGTSLVIIGAILQTASYGRVQFIIGRVVGGIGTGLNTSIIPIWYVRAGLFCKSYLTSI